MLHMPLHQIYWLIPDSYQLVATPACSTLSKNDPEWAVACPCPLESGIRGLEFKHCSTCASNVTIPSWVRLVVPIVRIRCCLADRTAASHSLPKCGAPGGINFHWISSLAHQLKISRRSLLHLSGIIRVFTSFRDFAKFRDVASASHEAP